MSDNDLLCFSMPGVPYHSLHGVIVPFYFFTFSAQELYHVYLLTLDDLCQKVLSILLAGQLNDLLI